MKWFFVALAMLVAQAQTASAAEVVALGASNTFGRGNRTHPDGVDQGQAFPAQLERLLRNGGCNVTVQNAGVPGDTTYELKMRLPGVLSSDTKVVILETPIGNDRIKNLTDTSDNVAAIKAYAHDHNVAVVPLGNWLTVAGIEHRQPDGQHFDEPAHLAMAKYLLPNVRRAVGCR